MRGRDIGRWSVSYAGQYLIKIESSENVSHAWSGKQPKQAEEIFAREFPAIHRWLDGYRKQLIERGDKGTYFWELRSCAYWTEFAKPKIVYQEINRTDAFAYDAGGHFLNNKLFMIPAGGPFLLALFCSKLGSWFIHTYSGVPTGGFLALQWPIMAQFPIPTATPAQQAAIEQIADYLLWLHRQPAVTAGREPRDPVMLAFWEQVINALVYEIFFPAELAAARLAFFRLVDEAALRPLAELPTADGRKTCINDAERLHSLRTAFERLDARSHPLRAALSTLAGLDFVRLIEGRERPAEIREPVTAEAL